MADHVDINVKDFRFLGAQIQCWHFRMRNNSGTLQHQIGLFGSPQSAGNLIGKINGASATYTNTPNGADATTGFAAGVKISSAAPNRLIFETASQAVANFAGTLTLVQNSTGTQDIWLRPVLTSRDVNGTTRTRLEVGFLTSTEATFDLNTTNIGTDDQIELLFFGFMK